MPHGKRASSWVSAQVLVQPREHCSLIAGLVADSALTVEHDDMPAAGVVAVVAVASTPAAWLERRGGVAEVAVVTGRPALVVVVVAGRRPGAVNVRLRLTSTRRTPEVCM